MGSFTVWTQVIASYPFQTQKTLIYGLQTVDRCFLFLMERGQKMRLSELIDKCFDPLWKDRKGKKIFRSQLRRAVEYLDDPDIADITTESVDNFTIQLENTISHRGVPLTNSTVNRNLSVLHSVLDYAHKREWIKKKPHFTWKTENSHRVRWLSDDEEKRLLAAMRARVAKASNPQKKFMYEQAYAAVVILLDTGMRRGELLSLQPDNIDGDWIRLWSTKTGKPRSIPMTPRAKELVEKHVPFSIEDWRLYYFWCRAKEEIGLKKDDQFVLHTLRHSCATRLLRKTHNIAMVQKMLGHSKIQTTLRYAHIDDEDLYEAVNS